MTKLRAAALIGAIAVFVLLVAMSFVLEHNTAASLGLAFMTASGLLITPEIFETFAKAQLLTLASKEGWRKKVSWVSSLFTLAGFLLGGWGIDEGHVRSPASLGRSLVLGGSVALVCGLFGFTVLWLARIFRDVNDSLDDKELREKLNRGRWPVSLAAVFFVIGTILQFIATATG